jgi:hypothetical protein
MMLRTTRYLFSALALTMLAACSQPAEESAPEAPAKPAAAVEPTPAAQPQPAPEPEPKVALPEGLPKQVYIDPSITVTEANTLNAEENRYEIKGETSSNVAKVMKDYVKYFRENGWEEDMIMEQEINTVVSFKKDGLLQYVEADVGGPGSLVTITTGNY